MGDADEELDLEVVDIRRGDGTRVSNADLAAILEEAHDATRDLSHGEPPGPRRLGVPGRSGATTPARRG